MGSRSEHRTCGGSGERSGPPSQVSPQELQSRLIVSTGGPPRAPRALACATDPPPRAGFPQRRTQTRIAARSATRRVACSAARSSRATMAPSSSSSGSFDWGAAIYEAAEGTLEQSDLDRDIPLDRQLRTGDDFQNTPLTVRSAGGRVPSGLLRDTAPRGSAPLASPSAWPQATLGEHAPVSAQLLPVRLRASGVEATQAQSVGDDRDAREGHRS